MKRPKSEDDKQDAFVYLLFFSFPFLLHNTILWRLILIIEIIVLFSSDRFIVILVSATNSNIVYVSTVTITNISYSLYHLDTIWNEFDVLNDPELILLVYNIIPRTRTTRLWSRVFLRLRTHSNQTLFTLSKPMKAVCPIRANIIVLFLNDSTNSE